MEGEGPGGEGVRLAPLPRPAEDRLNPGQEDGDVVGLGDVVVAPQAEGLQLVQGGVPAGDDDDGHRALPPQGGAQGEAVLAREAQVQQHQVRPEGLDLPGDGGKVRHPQDLVALVLQQQGQLLPDGGVVLDEGNAFHGMASFHGFPAVIVAQQGKKRA